MTTLAATAAALLTAALMLLTQHLGTPARRRIHCPARHARPTPSRHRCRTPSHQWSPATCHGKANHPENLLTSPPRFLIGAKSGQSAGRNGESHAAAGRGARVISAADVFVTADLVLLTQWACAPATPRSAPHMTAATHRSGLPAARTGGRP